MKKGFTLVELLAVIVILSIIAIITIPMISNVIEKSKLGAMEDSAYGLIDAANYYYAEHMNEMSSNKLFVIENGIGTSEEKLNYKGKIEGNAKILLTTNGKVALCLTNGKSYAKKEITNSKVVMNTVSSDTTCEINGIDSESDITIDISGSNSSYYNKNEIDDKLNDLKIEIAKGNEDLTKLETKNKESLVGAINEVKSISLTYNEQTDCFGMNYNGEWIDILNAGLKTDEALVPTMTSNTLPYGQAIGYKLNSSGGDVYLAFDSNDSTVCDQSYGSSINITNMYLGYIFPNPVVVNKVKIVERVDSRYKIYTFALEYSNDGSNWTSVEVFDATNGQQGTELMFKVQKSVTAKYWRIKGLTSQNQNLWMVSTLQFYGRKIS